jgi:cap1 methyltransferase
MENVKLDLPAETLLFGELVSELQGEAKAQRSIKVLHVMDAFVLGGNRIDGLAFEERLDRCKIFAKAVNKPTRTDLARVYVKEPFRLDALDSLFVK